MKFTIGDIVTLQIPGVGVVSGYGEVLDTCSRYGDPWVIVQMHECNIARAKPYELPADWLHLSPLSLTGVPDDVQDG